MENDFKEKQEELVHTSVYPNQESEINEIKIELDEFYENVLKAFEMRKNAMKSRNTLPKEQNIWRLICVNILLLKYQEELKDDIAEFSAIKENISIGYVSDFVYNEIIDEINQKLKKITPNVPQSTVYGYWSSDPKDLVEQKRSKAEYENNKRLQIIRKKLFIDKTREILKEI